MSHCVPGCKDPSIASWGSHSSLRSNLPAFRVLPRNLPHSGSERGEDDTAKLRKALPHIWTRELFTDIPSVTADSGACHTSLHTGNFF